MKPFISISTELIPLLLSISFQPFNTFTHIFLSNDTIEFSALSSTISLSDNLEYIELFILVFKGRLCIISPCSPPYISWKALKAILSSFILYRISSSLCSDFPERAEYIFSSNLDDVLWLLFILDRESSPAVLFTAKSYFTAESLVKEFPCSTSYPKNKESLPVKFSTSPFSVPDTKNPLYVYSGIAIPFISIIVPAIFSILPTDKVLFSFPFTFTIIAPLELNSPSTVRVPISPQLPACTFP